MKDPLVATPGPEIVIGLVGPIGCNLVQVTRCLIAQLTAVGYRTEEVRLSGLLHQVSAYKALKLPSKQPEDQRIIEHMDAGSDFRQKTNRGDVLALMAIAEIRRRRTEINKERTLAAGKLEQAPRENFGDEPAYRVAYILRSLKHPDELATLRDVYGRAFFTLSVYSPVETRVQTLTSRIEDDSTRVTRADAEKRARDLVRRDEEEELPSKLGQSVREAFPLSDYFLDTREVDQTASRVKRFVQILFGHPFVTPTRDELCMYYARAVSMRSADLARQVGAVIASKDGSILSAGCNEVPKSGGGMYWGDEESIEEKQEEAEGDARDFRLGYDSSAKFKKQLLHEVIEVLEKSGLVIQGNFETSEQLANELVFGDRRSLMRDTLFANLIEHGRSVHAEMAALSDAASRGVSVQGQVLYTTTFPCHLCAKHIVAAGIERVVYVEPYPKSLAGRLYADSIVIDPETTGNAELSFSPFVGVAPSAYSFAFQLISDRKTPDGVAVKWNPKQAEPKFRQFVASYIFLEQDLVGVQLPNALKRGGFTIV